MSDRPDGWEYGFFKTDNPHTKTTHHIRFGTMPEPDNHKFTVVNTTGYGKYMELCYENFKHFHRRGGHVYAMDWHGQGYSGRHDPDNPNRPSTEGMMQHVHDMHEFVERYIKPNHPKDKPLILSTNSMGGHITMLYLREYPNDFDGVIMSAPLFRNRFLNITPRLWPALKCVFNTLAKVGYRKYTLRDMPLRASWEKLKVYRPDGAQSVRAALLDKIHQNYLDAEISTPTIGWLSSVFKTAVEIEKPEFLKSIRTPILLGTSGLDSFVDNLSHDEAFKYLPNSDRVVFTTTDHTLWTDSDKNVRSWKRHVNDFIEKIVALKQGQDVKFDDHYIEDLPQDEYDPEWLNMPRVVRAHTP